MIFLLKTQIGKEEIMSALVKILLIIGCILLLIRFRLRLSAVIWLAAAFLGFLFQLSPLQIASSFLHAIWDPGTVKLMASLLLILFFSAVMKETGNMGRAISSLQEIFRDARATVAIIPAVIGILPVPGGAILSAPLVNEASDDLQLSKERRTFLNYWFRHIWEYSLPTYPGIILISSIVGVPVAKIFWANFPLTLASIVVGIVWGFRGIPPSPRPAVPLTWQHAWHNTASLLRNLLPLFLLLLLTLYFRLHLLYSTLIPILAMILFHRLSLPRIRRLAKESFSWEIVFLISGIMIFKRILETSGAMSAIAGDFTQLGMPIPLLIIAIPCLFGFITGYATGMAGLSFPVLLPFILGSESIMVYIMLAYGLGMCVTLLSPTHACLILTREYYRADIAKIYRLLFFPVAIVFCTGIGIGIIVLGMG
jgi:integral membrane protein (TIGR00529 family)